MTSTAQAELLGAQGATLLLECVAATGSIQGQMLEMCLEQRFRNPGDKNTEVIYTFPLPWGAVLLGVNVQLNGEHLSGQVTAKMSARAQFEEALLDGNTAILLEHNSDRSYTLQLGNLLAGETCVVAVRYGQVLQLEHGQLRLMLPTTMAPRYGNALTQGRLQLHQVAESDLLAEYAFDISVSIYGPLAKASAASPSHKIAYSPKSDGLEVRLVQKGALDRDFILILSDLPQHSIGLACPDTSSPGKTAVMVSFSPKLHQSAGRPVMVKALVDCSGSMLGDSIEAAKASLRSIVAGLRTEDRFTLSRFGSTVEHRCRGMWSGSAAAKASGSRWIDQLTADLGGTEMEIALASTLALNSQGACDILLITDGEIHGIDEVIATAKSSDHRVFVVGIGASPAEAHLRRLAGATGGSCDFVAPGEDVGPAVHRMFSRLRSPKIQGLIVDWPTGWQVEWTNDLANAAFDGDALSIYASVAEETDRSAAAKVKLFAEIGDNGEPSLIAEAEVYPYQDASNTLARMAGHARVQQLGEAEHVDAEEQACSVELALKYQLVTSETNFILVHEREGHEKPTEMPELHKVPQMVPAGWGGFGSVDSARLPVPGDISTQSLVLRSSLSDLRQLNEPIARFCFSGTPAVWRGRGSAASKADALSLGGMDDYEIPTFLRKEADDESVSKLARNPKRIDKENPDLWMPQWPMDLPAGQFERWLQDNPNHLQILTYEGLTPGGVVEWLNVNPTNHWPQNYAELHQIGLGRLVCEWLEFVVGDGRLELEVVPAFLQAMLKLELAEAVGWKRIARSLANAVGSSPSERTEFFCKTSSALVNLIYSDLQGLKVREWPDKVVNFAEAETQNEERLHQTSLFSSVSDGDDGHDQFLK